MLHAEPVWNRDDDRVCSDDERAGARSLFCVLHQQPVVKAPRRTEPGGAPG